uniref:Nuclear envelope pore membrane protein POM 121C n=1 Tax=Sus scrofa TaxID=9823 RepID=A0A8W4FBZ2_PIG
GLVLYLLPAAAALDPRGSARRQRTLLASPSAKCAVNGNLLEPRSLLGRTRPRELLLMGNYLSKPAPPQPASTPEARDVRERPGRRPAAGTAPPAPSAHPHRAYSLPSRPTPLLRPSRRPSHPACGTSLHRFVITPRRRYPIQQARYSLPGVLPTVCWNGCPKKTVLSARNSKVVCSPVTVRIAPPDSKLTRSGLPDQGISSTLSSPSTSTPDPCAKETEPSALKERRKRTVEEEDQTFADGQEAKRRRHDSSGGGHSAFQPVVANGVPASFVPKPGSLKRGLNSQSSDDPLNKRSRTSSLSSLTSTYTAGIPSSSRNAITSSYSSTGGLSQLRKRSGPSSSPFSSSASSHSQTPERPAKKRREEELSHHSSSATPLVTDKKSQGEKVADTTTWKKQNSWNFPSTPGSSGQRKRKVQLLPSRRGDPLILPPPPQLGYSVTAEDLDLEKKALLQWFNKILEDKTDTASTSVPESPPTSSQPFFTLTLPAADSAASTASLPAPSANPLLESLKKTQSSPGLPSFPESAGMATTLVHSPPKTPSPLAPLGSSQSGPLLGTSSDSKSTATFLGLTPVSSTGLVTDTTKAPPAPQAETSAKPQAPSAPSPTPKQNIPFEMLSTPSANPSAVSSASPMFNPIFLPPPKSEKEGPLPSSPSKVTATASSSSAVPMTTSSPSLTFKPVFSTMAPPATTTSTPLFNSQASATPAAASVTTASTSTDFALKPTFSFCVSSMTSTLSTMTSTTVATSQPFLFGTPPASDASFTPAMGSIFQFGKPPTMPTATSVTAFGQSLPSAAQTAASSSSTAGFSGFGSTLTASTQATTSQPMLPFSSPTAPAFNIPFGSSAKPSLPLYPGANPQPSFGATDGHQQGAATPALVPSFGSSFTFENAAAPTLTATPVPAPAQPAFGSTMQSAFGDLKATASVFGTPASTQPAFGSTFSFGAATTSGLGATTQTTGSGTSSSVLGSITPCPFKFGELAVPICVATPGTSSASGAFSFGAGQSGPTGNMIPFGGGLSRNSLGAPSQNASFAFSMASTLDSKPVFGGTAWPTFGQSAPAPGVGTSGSSLSFGASSTSTQGFVGVGPFGSASPSFSIGAGSKPPGHTPKKQPLALPPPPPHPHPHLDLGTCQKEPLIF